MRQAFTQPNFHGAHNFFKTEGYGYRTFTEASAALDAMRRYLLREAPTREMTGFEAFRMLYLTYRFRKIQHFFLAPGIMPFALSCVKEISPEYFQSPPAILEARTDDDKDGAVTFALHFPVKERKHSILACLVHRNPDLTDSPTDFVGFAAYGDQEAFIYRVAEGDPYSPLAGMDGMDGMEDIDDLRLTVRAVYAFNLYIDAFPDTVVPAKDGSIACCNHYGDTSRRVYVRRSQALEEEERNSVDPHWRKGHPRLLQSERFTHKRWQVIWILGCMVKGRAFDVLDDAPAAVA